MGAPARQISKALRRSSSAKAAARASRSACAAPAPLEARGRRRIADRLAAEKHGERGAEVEPFELLEEGERVAAAAAIFAAPAPLVTFTQSGLRPFFGVQMHCPARMPFAEARQAATCFSTRESSGCSALIRSSSQRESRAIAAHSAASLKNASADLRRMRLRISHPMRRFT